ncbi:ATP-binding cassette domain-containing protein [Salinicoccus hispanicus]|uniref:ATP-binding cassette domain-containing protein n=1 Tax=Salinicoccus hispanicus TaxID=157225 RepID=A0A6N8TYP8_9STAP|nr:ABC transporter ATP-binding protein [Salinicoccus hispanicus]MXQ50890.1 ATP-binding cassette domain-containing protein [Salinicoccus hispanicus]
MTVLELKGLTKTFGKTVAAQDISFELEAGEVFGFIGPNGAGKSTTLRMIIGALAPDSGEILMDGKTVAGNRHYKQNIAYVPGDVNLWGNLTGEEVIRFFMEVRGYTDTARKDHLIAQFRLDSKKKCKTYSKGNRQKVALICAFLSDARLLIFDEPTSGLDPLMERTFHEQLSSAKAEGRSILLSSHILSEVEKLADRIAIIREGRIIETGPLETLRHITRTEYIVKAGQNLAEMQKLPYVHDYEETGDGTHMRIDNDSVGEFLEALALHQPHHLETLPPRLEDIFMRYYEDGSVPS